MVNNFKLDFEGDDLYKTPKVQEQERISILETFIPKAIVYLPVIGEVARPIIFKLIVNLSNQYEKKDTNQRRVYEIYKYYQKANQGCGSANAIVLFIASFVFMLASPYLIGIVSLPLVVSLIAAAVIIGLLPLFTLKENFRYFENPNLQLIRDNFEK